MSSTGSGRVFFGAANPSFFSLTVEVDGAGGATIGMRCSGIGGATGTTTIGFGIGGGVTTSGTGAGGGGGGGGDQAGAGGGVNTTGGATGFGAGSGSGTGAGVGTGGSNEEGRGGSINQPPEAFAGGAAATGAAGAGGGTGRSGDGGGASGSGRAVDRSLSFLDRTERDFFRRLEPFGSSVIVSSYVSVSVDDCGSSKSSSIDDTAADVSVLSVGAEAARNSSRDARIGSDTSVS